MLEHLEDLIEVNPSTESLGQIVNLYYWTGGRDVQQRYGVQPLNMELDYEGKIEAALA